MAEPFWMVWNERGSAPAFKHPTREGARQEAERLARQCNGSSFHVLRLEATVKRSDVTWQEAEEEHPF